MTESSAAITKSSGSNLAFTFALLPKKVRNGMVVYYAFCRVVDDIADDPQNPVDLKLRQLTEWRAEIGRCYARQAQTPLGRDLQKLITDVPSIPRDYFEELINGVEMDLSITRYKTFDELYRYCYRVASVVGLTSIEIFGCTDPKSRPYAIELGQALQLTNILRDIKKDAENDRVYLPAEVLAQFAVTEADLFQARESEGYFKMMDFLSEKAEGYYTRAVENLTPTDKPRLIAAEMMRFVYHDLLVTLRRQHYPSLRKTISLSKARKLQLMCKAWIHSKF
ncbi:MAG: squalene/phytoene synthase family protein [Verrucomicrobiae bacterium]|nr:squalene/phytoene synthase family protein [Verrucomicrobiae bacterium]